MDSAALIASIAVKDVDVNSFVQLAISDDVAREEIMRQLTTHPHIMVYYHCYYVVDQASQERPDLFYPYWDEMAALLCHKNSYHRDIGLTIIANLARVDQALRFPAIFDAYFAHLNDVKFMTGQCCVRNSIKIWHSYPGLRPRLLARLLDIDRQCTYPEKQKALLKGDVLEVLAAVYDQAAANRSEIDAFIQACTHSVSPKTRRMAAALAAATTHLRD